MDPTDQAHLHVVAQVLNEHMKGIGINADLQSMDWSTLVSRRAVKEPPPGAGGWHLFPTAWPSSAMMDPVSTRRWISAATPRTGSAGRATRSWRNCALPIFRQKTRVSATARYEAIQARFLEAAPYAYPGQYFPQIAYRKDRMKGPIGLGSPVFWNLEKFA